MAGYIPAVNYYGMIGDIGDTIANGLKEANKQRLLSALGSDISSGNYDSAAQRALQGGDIGIGMKLMELGKQAKTDAMLGPLLSSLGGGQGGAAVAAAPAASGDTSVPRGLRNNNPGNIEDGPFAKSMPGYAGSDGRFARFASLDNGVNAQSALLGKYGQQGINTVAGVVGKWAPSAENGEATGNYANFVAKKLGVDPNAPIDMSDPVTRQRMAYAMGEFENGRPVAGARSAPIQVAQAAAGGNDILSRIPPGVAAVMAGSSQPGVKALGEAVLKRNVEASFGGKDVPITDPAERAAIGIQPNDKRVVTRNSVSGKLTFQSDSKADEEAAKAEQPKVVARGGAIWKDGKVVYENKNEAGGARSAIGMFMRKYMDENPDASSEDISRAVQKFNSEQNALTKFTSGKQGDTIRSFNVLVHHLGTFGEVADALGNGDYKTLNRLSQRYAEETGKPAPTDFDAVKSLVGDEIVKAVVGGAGALGDREEVKHALDRANSPAQLRSVINRYRQLAGGQLSGLEYQYKRSTGLDNFDTMLMPATRDYMRSGGGHGAAPTPPAGGGSPAPGAGGGKSGVTSSGIKWSLD